MRKFRWMTAPIALLYGSILYVRNFLYNKGVLKSHRPSMKTIVLGNLSLGGTGKTPMVEYLLRLIPHGKVAVLSRGYGRETTGTYTVQPTKSTAREAGDEPLQIAGKFPEVPVVCDVDRLRGLEYIEKNFPETQIVILDDALQHRRLRGGLNILLTPFEKPFPRDHVLPWGELRDHPVRAHQADVFVVTKTPPSPDPNEKSRIQTDLDKYGKPVFFSTIRYGEMRKLFGTDRGDLVEGEGVIVVTGIAKPSYFLEEIRKKYAVVRHFSFPDHHAFTAGDLGLIRDFIGNFAGAIHAVITTEKDAVRLVEYRERWDDHLPPVYGWEIETDFGKRKSEFDQVILNYVDQP